MSARSGPEPQVEPGPPGCGCLKGCTLALLILAVMSIIAMAALVIFGRPWLAGQLTRWETQQPLLTPLLDYTGARGWLAGDTATEGRDGDRIQGGNDRDLVPNDIVLYQHPLSEAVSVSDSQVTVYQEVPESVDAVRSHLLDGMDIQGWALAGETAIIDGVRLVWTKDERRCQVDLVAGDRHTEAWLRCQAAP